MFRALSEKPIGKILQKGISIDFPHNSGILGLMLNLANLNSLLTMRGMVNGSILLGQIGLFSSLTRDQQGGLGSF